jgi:hypothetical protein
MDCLLAGLALAAVLQNNPPRTSAHISGIVVEEGTNLPVPFAQVRRVAADAPLFDDTHFTEVMTDRDGRFTFGGVVPARYRITAHHEGFAPQLDESAFPVVDVEAGQDVEYVTITLSHGGVISGKVVGLDGSPVAGTHAFALLQRLDINGVGDPPAPDGTPTMLPLGQGTTNNRGEFRFDKLPAGDYLVGAEANGARAPSGQAIGTTFYPSATQQSSARAVSVSGGETVKNVTITMAAVETFRVSGVVVDAGGSPVPNAGVQLMPDMRGGSFVVQMVTGAHGSAQTDGDGAFVFDAIPRGSYIVSADGGDLGGLEALTGTVVIDSTGTITAKTNGKTLPLAPGAAAVRVRDADVVDVRVVKK